jgi:flagellar hook-length control protein FliK/uncharacterized membrane protein YccF (DUF307 family)
MTMQIRRNQIANSQVNADKLDLSTGTFNFSGATVTVATPSADAEAATKAYVDSVAAGLDPKESCFVATTAAITLSGTQTIDGQSVTVGKRVLVKNQVSSVDNGIYICAAGSWSRSTDFATGSAEAGAYSYIEAGTDNGQLKFVCTSQAGSDVVGTNNITFGIYSGPDSTTAGDGLQKTGDAISVKLDGSTIAASASGIKVAAGAISNNEISDSAAIANSKLANSSVSLGGVSVALGGTDATPAFNLADATNYPTSSLVGTVSNAQLAGSISEDKLAGSISNGKLANSSVSFGGVSVALGAADATPAFDLADATNYPTSSLVGTITNAQLAGSIDEAKLAGSISNGKLANSSVSLGGVSVALGASDATPAFDLADATNYPTSSLVGTITNAQLAGSIDEAKLAGSISNAKLANSSVSFGGVSVALGAADATPAFDLADATNYPTSSLVGTITNAQLAGSIDQAKLAGSIPDTKLNDISSANKVLGSAVQLKASGSGLANDSGLKINTDGSTVQVNGSGQVEVKDNGITAAKVNFAPSIDFFSPNGTDTDFDLAATIPSGFEAMMVFRNGVALKQVGSSPSNVDEFALARTAGAGGVSQVQFGAAPSSSDNINCFYFA